MKKWKHVLSLLYLSTLAFILKVFDKFSSTMTFSGVFNFNALNDDLKRLVIDNISNSQDLLRFKACQKDNGLTQKEMQVKMQQLNTKDYTRAISILHRFTMECVGMEEKFQKNENVRNAHLEMFLNGYPKTNLLEDESMFEDYNRTFEGFLDDMARATGDREDNWFVIKDNTHIITNIINKLRFKNDLKEIAKEELFKPVLDDCTEHKLVLEFDSGIKMNVKITICNVSDDPQRSIEVDAYFVTKKNNKEHKMASYVISGANDEAEFELEDEDAADVPSWITNDPTGWIVTFMSKLKRVVGKNTMLGDMKSVNIGYCGPQFWEHAYLSLEVLPKLANI